MRILKRQKTEYPVFVAPGDTISLIYDDQTMLEETITEQAIYDETIIFEADKALKDELGISKGLGGLFAKRKEDD